MRFLYYDKIDIINKGKDIIGVKTFSLSEEFFRGHFTKKPLIPGVIYIEAMAQLLGWLIIYTHNFNLSSIMTLIDGVRVCPDLRPGIKATIHGEIINTNKRDSLGRAWMTVDGDEIARINRIIYSHFHNVDSDMLKRWFHYYSGIDVRQ
ncbi:MAG: hypothetical protein N3A62_04770 [Thermodesulfovibrionales bacterium]|nr:hypothetical protein [Thermodesulfovibrionales bacterium]